MTRRRPWDEEADAANRLAGVLGGKATRRDVAGGAPTGTHDYDIVVVVDEEVVALEVTQHAVGPILAQRALEAKLDWTYDQLTSCWIVDVRGPCDLHRLRAEIIEVLQTFEADGRDRRLPNQSADDAPLDGRLRRLGVKLIYRLSDATPGEVLVGSASVGGSTSPEVIVDFVNDHANRPDNVAKLRAAATAIARRLWIWVHSDRHQAVAAMTSTCCRIPCLVFQRGSTSSGSPPPTRRPPSGDWIGRAGMPRNP